MNNSVFKYVILIFHCFCNISNILVKIILKRENKSVNV